MKRTLYWHDSKDGIAIPTADLLRSALAVRGRLSQQFLHTPSWGGLLVIVDGQSGGGKTTLATHLKQDLTLSGCAGMQILSLDSWYPGWAGLAGGQRLAEQLVMGNLRAYPQWDWEHSRVGRWVSVDSTRPTIIEGSGLLTPATHRRAHMSIWVQAAEEQRKFRALERDGQTYRPWWDMWARQERRHIKTNHPRQLADIEIRT